MSHERRGGGTVKQAAWHPLGALPRPRRAARLVCLLVPLLVLCSQHYPQGSPSPIAAAGWRTERLPRPLYVPCVPSPPPLHHPLRAAAPSCSLSLSLTGGRHALGVAYLLVLLHLDWRFFSRCSNRAEEAHALSDNFC
jgi:hypothetical protein